MESLYVEDLNQSLKELLEEHPEVYILGEDICDPSGGAFKVTRSLSTQFPTRVINTPISEAAITGIAAGMAIRGFKPILEIMFGDFMTLCADQIINSIAKFNWMYAGKANTALVIRVPMGGRRGYGPTHSQTLEKIYLGIPGIHIVSPSHFHEVGKLLKKAVLEDKSPVLFIENKSLYSEPLKLPIDGYVGTFAVRVSSDFYPTLLLSSNDFEEADITIVTYGGMALIVEEAAEELLMEEEVTAEIIIPSSIKPFVINNILESVKKTKRLLLVEEGSITLGWSAEVAALVSEQLLPAFPITIKRIGAKDLPIGSSKTLEEKILPQKKDIKEGALEIVQK